MMMAGIDRRAIVTFLLLCLVIGIDKADQLLLPAVYLEICREFSIAARCHGLITCCCAAAAAAACSLLTTRWPLRSSPAHLVWRAAVGHCIRSVGAATSIEALSGGPLPDHRGAGLGLTIPLIFALVADLAREGKRGRAFGLLLFAANGGGASAHTLPRPWRPAAAGEGVAGWRLAFYSIAVRVSRRGRAWSYALRTSRGAAAAAADSPAATSSSSAEPAAAAAATAPPPFTFRGAVHDAWSVLRVKSFALILAQGAVGSTPVVFHVLLTMYLQTPQHATTAQQQHLPPPHSHPFRPPPAAHTTPGTLSSEAAASGPSIRRLNTKHARHGRSIRHSHRRFTRRSLPRRSLDSRPCRTTLR